MVLTVHMEYSFTLADILVNPNFAIHISNTMDNHDERQYKFFDMNFKRK